MTSSRRNEIVEVACSGSQEETPGAMATMQGMQGKQWLYYTLL